MKAADYLKIRGWVRIATDDGFERYSDSADLEMRNLVEDDAVTVQRARDEEKAREAWVAFAAARLAMGVAEGETTMDHFYDVTGAAKEADQMLALYRKRFCPEVKS